MNRLRAHFANQQVQKPQRRLQSAIVADYRADIISLIADDGATLPEVAAAVRAEGGGALLGICDTLLTASRRAPLDTNTRSIIAEQARLMIDIILLHDPEDLA